MPGKQPHKRWWKKLLIAVLVLCCTIMALLYYLLATLDIEKHRARITSLVSNSIGREVRIEGQIEIHPSWRPKIEVEDIVVGNPAWASTPHLATINRLVFQAALWPLLKKRLEILQLDLIGADVHLERNDDNIPNWLMTWSPSRSAQGFPIPSTMPVYIEDSALTFHVKSRPPVILSLHRLKATLGMEELFTLEGTVNLETLPVRLSLEGGKIEQLLDKQSAWPLQGAVLIDRVPVRLEGSITNPVLLKEVQLTISTGSNSGTTFDDISDNPINIGNTLVDIHVSAVEGGHQVAIKSKASDLNLTDEISFGGWRPVFGIKLGSLESTYKSYGRSIGDIIFNGNMQLQANKGEILWQPENAAEPDALMLKSVSIQADPGQPVKTEVVSWQGALKTVLSVQHGRIVNLLWSDTPWPFQARLLAAGVKAGIEARVRPPGNDRQIDGTAYATIGGVERIGMLFDLQWPGLGPASITCDFTISSRQMLVNNIEGIFAKAPFRGQVMVIPGEPSKARLGFSMHTIDVGNLIPGSQPDTAISIQAEGLEFNIDASGNSILEMFQNASWNLKVPAGTVSWHDQSDAHHQFSFSQFSSKGGQNRSINFSTNLRRNEIDMQLHGVLGSPAELFRGDLSVPARLNLHGDGIAVDFDGSLHIRDERLHIGGGIEMQSTRTDAWGQLLGVDWTHATPFSASVKVEYRPGRVLLQDIKITAIGVRIAGEVSYAQEASPRAQAHIKSGLIDFSEIISRIDDRDDAPSAKQDHPKPQRVIPDLSLEHGLLESMDARLSIDALKIMAGDELITELSGIVNCINGVFSVSAFKGKSWTGATSMAEITWDTTATLPTAVLSWETRDFDYGLVVESLGLRSDIVGELDLRLNLEGRGPTLREVLGSADGNLEIILGPGRTPRRVLELWGGGLLRLLIPTTWFEKDITDLNCAVGRFGILNGVVKSDVLLTDTSQITVAGEVAIDLKTEEISGLFEPKSKQPSLLQLGTPIRIGGTLANITAVSARSRIVSLGKMILGLSHPSTMILLFGDIGTAEKNPCKALLEQRPQSVE